MIRTLTAHTYEIDDAELALEEIQEQLHLQEKLLTHSVGLLTCYAEFLDSGVVEAISEAMPFDVIGCTTMASATGGEMGTLMLSLAVLTSDDIRFSTALTGPLDEEQDGPLSEAYTQARETLGEEPTMMFTFAPLIGKVGGEHLVNCLDTVSKGLPNFGTVAVDHTNDYHESKTIYNGKGYRTRLAMALVAGEVDAKFFIASISDSRVQKQTAVITKSEKNVLMEVNDMPLLDYLATLGITKGNGLDSAVTIPFIINYNDGTKPIARAIYLVTDDGYAVCGGDMPVDATLAIGSLDFQDVITTSTRIMERALATGKDEGMLITTCLTRLLVLGPDTTAEMEKICALAEGAAPYQMFYSGGEICPVYDEDGKLVNRFHNDTFCACVF